MKNILVDALRGTNETSDSNAAELPLNEPPASALEDSVGDGEFDLVQSTVLPESFAVTPPSESAPDEEEVGIGVLEDVSLASADDDATQLLPALVTESDEQSHAAAPHWAPQGQTSPHADLFHRVARLSPVLSLVTLVATAGSAAVYERITAQRLNVDLAGLSVSGVDAESAGSANGWRALPDTEAVTVTAAPPSDSRPTQFSVPVVPASGSDAASDKQKLSRVTSPLPDPAFHLIEGAYQSYQDADLAGAETGYREALVVAPLNHHALRGLAAVLQKQGRIKEAIEVYVTLLEVLPEDGDAIGALLALANAGEGSQQEVVSKTLLQRYPQSASLHFAIGISCADRGDWPTANRFFSQASTLAPDNADYSFNAAVSAEHLGYLDRARSLYRQTLATLGAASAVQASDVNARLLALSVSERDGA